MAYDYNISITVQPRGEEVTLAGQFEPEAWLRLEEFIECADELLNTKLVQNGMQALLNITFDASGMRFAPQLPPWDDVLVFLHRFRPIGLQKEDANFYKICNILAKELLHPYVYRMIQDQRDIYLGKRLQSMYAIYINDELLNSEKVLFDWLNAYEYHRLKEKQEFINELHEIFPLDASKAIFIALLAEKASAIHDVAVFTKVILGRESSTRGRIRDLS